MSMVCKECGFENEDGDKYCAMCNADLSKSDVIKDEIKPVNNNFSHPYDERETLIMAQTKTVAQTNEVPSISSDIRKKFYVNCENSRTKTFVDSADITSYYCEGCKEEHQIDNFFWSVQEVEDNTEVNDSNFTDTVIEQIDSDSGQHLVLEEVETHVKIEVSSVAGTFGRYGTYGASFLQNDPRGRMVSCEHCKFKYEYGRWSIEHLSRTNDTNYNGRKLEHGFEEALRDGKIITFANAISFIIRIY